MKGMNNRNNESAFSTCRAPRNAYDSLRKIYESGRRGGAAPVSTWQTAGALRLRKRSALRRIVRYVFQTATFALLAIIFSQAALSEQKQGSRSRAEQFVLQNILSGGEADLAELSARPEDRVLGHEFLETLLTGGYARPNGYIRAIKIENAVIDGKLDVASGAISYAVWLTNCDFHDGVDFSGARLAGDLSLQNSSFGVILSSPQSSPPPSSEDAALFIGMYVNGSTILNGTTFYIPLDFTYAQISGQFLFDSVHFQSSGYADFNGLKTGAPAFFRHDHFSGPIALTDAGLFELFLQDITFDLEQIASDVPEVNLDRSQITRELSIKDVAFRWLEAQYLVVAGPSTFDNVRVSKRLSLAHSHFQTLTVKDLAQWRQATKLDIDFEGLSFEGVDVPEANIDDYASRMLDLMTSERYKYYSPQPYLELEKFLRSHGNPEKADDVYIQMRRRERQELVLWKWPGDWLLDVLLGYGRKPWRAAFYSLALALLGAAVFRKPRMEAQASAHGPSWYSPFWYSLDTLAPVIDLGQAKNWEPKPGYAWVRNYALFQRIAGWVLIPLILGAITGIIR
jgi:hypothetical protein